MNKSKTYSCLTPTTQQAPGGLEAILRICEGGSETEAVKWRVPQIARERASSRWCRNRLRPRAGAAGHPLLYTPRDEARTVTLVNALALGRARLRWPSGVGPLVAGRPGRPGSSIADKRHCLKLAALSVLELGRSGPLQRCRRCPSCGPATTLFCAEQGAAWSAWMPATSWTAARWIQCVPTQLQSLKRFGQLRQDCLCVECFQGIL